jgi:hypothetical protein
MNPREIEFEEMATMCLEARRKRAVELVWRIKGAIFRLSMANY